jgi:tRNA 2-selenouridine synthase
MAAERITIERFLELAKVHPVLDVRSPGEYNHAHLPGAHSLPLFSDEERKLVGTAYKQESREQAIKIGLDYFGVKMRSMVETAEQLITTYKKEENDKTILVYCWRGGMRSAGVAWLLDLYGFKVYTLAGGYKKFRNKVLETFTLPFRFNILGGYTGSGKTETLKIMQRKGEKVVDLEGIAVHKGSAFGAIGLPPQPGQEMFENLLATELMLFEADLSNPDADPIWLEDESQRIGMVNIPGALWANMRQSPVYFADIPFEERLNHIVQEYGVLEQQKLIDATSRIRERLGGMNAKTVTMYLLVGNIAGAFRILLEYYDRFYIKALHNREALHALLYTVTCKSITAENAEEIIRVARNRSEKV